MSLIYIDVSGHPAWVRADTIVDAQVVTRDGKHMVLLRRELGGALANVQSAPFEDEAAARDALLRIVGLVNRATSGHPPAP